MYKIFNPADLKKIYKPKPKSSGEDNGQVTIIGGSSLFHGAPLLSLKVASRVVDMVFFASPEESVGRVAEQIKSETLSFIWIPWKDVDDYISKSDAVLIGPGFMRFGTEKTPEIQRGYEKHKEGKFTRQITENLLKKFPNKRWVIDAGSLQTMEEEWIPESAVLTPNIKEFELVFKLYQPLDLKHTDQVIQMVSDKAKEHSCVIVLKGPETIVCSPNDCVIVKNGNPGLTKGGTGDVLAGLTVALLAKNDPFLSAGCASYVEKAAADDLYTHVGTHYNADDLADHIPQTLHKLIF